MSREGEKERIKEKIESERDSSGCHILYELWWNGPLWSQECFLFQRGTLETLCTHVCVFICVCVVLESPSSLSHGSLSPGSLFTQHAEPENKVNKQWRVVGQPSFTPKTKQCPPTKHPLGPEQRHRAPAVDAKLSDIWGAICHFWLEKQTPL